MTTARIVLPLPPRNLSPNCPVASRRGMIAKAVAAKRQRLLAIDAVKPLGIEDAPWERVEVTCHFYHKQDRRRDDINSLAMLKSAFDGIVQGGLAVDDDHNHWTTLAPSYHMDKACPRVEIFVTKVEIEKKE